jgi:hypothetical protein
VGIDDLIPESMWAASPIGDRLKGPGRLGTIPSPASSSAPRMVDIVQFRSNVQTMRTQSVLRTRSPFPSHHYSWW